MNYQRLLFCCAIVGCFNISGFFSVGIRAQESDFKGQLSGWSREQRYEGERYYNTGARYLPQGTLEIDLGEERLVDAELALNFYAWKDSEEEEVEKDAKLYRFKVRFVTPQTETRAGLQKINFGPAKLLRSLKWFDHLDPRDPLQFTEGVWGVRFAYNALNNASLWLWGLYGNDEPKGYESLPSVDDESEFGGRFQFPVPAGEAAITLHTRTVDAINLGGSNFTEVMGTGS